jgi:predicted transcriptional regulator
MTFTARFPRGLEERLTEIAKEHRLPRHVLIVKILVQWVEEYDAKRKVA